MFGFVRVVTFMLVFMKMHLPTQRNHFTRVSDRFVSVRMKAVNMRMSSSERRMISAFFKDKARGAILIYCKSNAVFEMLLHLNFVHVFFSITLPGNRFPSFFIIMCYF